MFDYKGKNKELLKLSKLKVYDYTKIKKCLKKNKKRNNRVLKCIDKVNRILDRENKYINKQCKKQIHNKMKGRMENPRVYMDEILFNKKKKKLSGGNILNFDLKDSYEPFKYILDDFSMMNNKLNNYNPEKINKINLQNYYFNCFLHISLIVGFLCILIYIYYNKLLH